MTPYVARCGTAGVPTFGTTVRPTDLHGNLPPTGEGAAPEWLMSRGSEQWPVVSTTLQGGIDSRVRLATVLVTVQLAIVARNP